MPRLIADGPDLPPELLEAQADGELVLFCGAGVSMSAGLPNFKRLVQQVYRQVGISRSDAEKRFLRVGSFEIVLQLLEREHGEAMRRAVIASLQPQPSWSRKVHQALLALSESTYGLRLVTTNFDRLFLEAADPGKKLPLDVASRLPIPRGDHWASLVHLHGLIHDDDPEGRNLILTSADFGRAYLLDGWASRFVAELFRNFTVLFVGYSVSDPVMRYLTDAISSERQKGGPFREPYALAGVKDKNERLDWEAKGLRLAFYDSLDKHRLLNETLEAWADLALGGLTARKSIAHRLAPAPPAHDQEDDAKLMVWALSEPAGKVAEAFARLDPVPPFEWLDLLWKSRPNLLSLAPPIERDHLGKKIPPQMPLADGGWRTASVAPLSPVTRALGSWLCHYLKDPRMIDWVISNGGSLHPQFADQVRASLKDLTEPFAQVWQSLVGDLPLKRSLRWQRSGVWDKVQQGHFDDFIRLELLHGLTLVLDLRRRSALWGALKEVDADSAAPSDPLTSRDLVDVELRLLGGLEAEIGLGDLLASPQPGVLAALTEGGTTILRDGLDLLAHSDGASAAYDPMVYGHPSISPHEQNRYGEPYFLFVDLLREGMAALVSTDSASARRLLATWQAQRYPIFRRLVLHAVTEHPELGLEAALHILLREGSYDLWSSTCKREGMRFLRMVGKRLGTTELAALLDTILRGPAAGFFREGLTPEKVRDAEAWLIWHRLAKLRQGEVELPASVRLRLEELEPLAGAPLEPDHRDEFTVWHETSRGMAVGLEPTIPLEQLEVASARELAQTLRLGLERGALAELAQSRPLKVPRALRCLARGEEEARLAWSEALSGFGSVNKRWRRRAPFAKVVSRALVVQTILTLRDALYAASAWLTSQPWELTEAEEAVYFFPLWDQLVPHSLARESGDQEMAINDSESDPAGLLTSALLRKLWTRKPGRTSGIPLQIRTRLDSLLAAAGYGGLLARVWIFGALGSLHDVDPKWANSKLIPLLNWEATEARVLWEAYLKSPRWSPDLVAGVRTSFLAMIEHLDEIRDTRHNGPQLLVAISLYYPGGLSALEVQRALAALKPMDLAHAARFLREFLKEAEGPEVTWKTKIGPWIERHWPTAVSSRTSDVTLNLALVVIEAGPAFAEAFAIVRPYLSEVDGRAHHSAWQVNSALSKGRHADEHPREALDLLTLLIRHEDAVPGYRTDLQDLLGRIATAAPELTQDPRFRRLRDIAS